MTSTKSIVFLSVLKQEKEKFRLICGGLKRVSIKAKNKKLWKIDTIIKYIGFYNVAKYLEVFANIISAKISSF